MSKHIKIGLVIALSCYCTSEQFALAYDDPARASAIELMKQKDYDKALKKLAEAIGLDATDPTNYMLRAKCFMHLNNNDLAIADLDKVVDLEPNSWRGYLLRGIAFRRIGKDEQSRKDFDKAISIEPQKANKSLTMLYPNGYSDAKTNVAHYTDGENDLEFEQ